MDDSTLIRFNKFFEMDTLTNCWIWIGAQRGKRYGNFSINGNDMYPHRVSYEHYKGKIPKGFDIDHLCRHTLCVNPEHLEPVSHKENCQRGIVNQNKGKLFCKRGHEFTPENTYVGPQHNRFCITCKNNRNRIFAQKKRDEMRYGHS